MSQESNIFDDLLANEIIEKQNKTQASYAEAIYAQLWATPQN